METYTIGKIERDRGQVKIHAIRKEDGYKKVYYISDLKTLAEYEKELGKFFFSPGAMNFFKCRIGKYDIESGYFVTSEKGPDNVRKYTIRQMDYRTGNIATIGEFQQYATLKQAISAFNKLVNRKEN